MTAPSPRNVDIPCSRCRRLCATPDIYRLRKKLNDADRCAAFDDRLPLNRATAYSVPGVYPRLG